MKKTVSSLAVLALGCGLATSAVAPAEAAKTTHVRTSMHLSGDFDYKPDTDTVTIHGAIKAKDVCKKGRKVTVRQTDAGVNVGTVKTDGKGKWVLKFKGDKAAPGTFKATALKDKRKRGKVVCGEASDKAKLGG